MKDFCFLFFISFLFHLDSSFAESSLENWEQKAREICEEKKVDLSGSDNFLKMSLSEDTHMRYFSGRIERVQYFCDLRSNVLQSYGGLEWPGNESRDSAVRKSLNQCIVREYQQKVTGTLSDIVGHWDRLAQCIASLQDGHFSLDHTLPPPWVHAGIRLKEISGPKESIPENARVTCTSAYCTAYVISGVDSGYLKKIETGNIYEPFSKWLIPGVFVIAIDDLSILKTVERLAKFVPASTSGHRRTMALRSIFSRNYSYPKKNIFRIKLVNSSSEEKVIELPWHRSIEGHDAGQMYLKDLDIEALGYEPERRLGPRIELNPPLFESLLKNDVGFVAQQHSYRQGESICYFKVRAFNDKRFYPDMDTNGEKISILESLQYLVQRCNEKDYPVILDMRENPGGDLQMALGLAALFNPTKKPLTGLVGALRTSQQIYNFLNFSIYGNQGRGKYIESVDFLQALYQAFNNLEPEQKYTDFVDIASIPASPYGEKPFRQKLVLLVSELCVSSCDIFAQLIKKHKMGTLVGRVTSGAVIGSFQTEIAESVWKPRGVSYAVLIPMLALAYPNHKNFEKENSTYDKSKVDFVEAIGVSPHIYYQETVDDVEFGNGWSEEVRKILFTKEELQQDKNDFRPKKESEPIPFSENRNENSLENFNRELPKTWEI